jgi:hypothetical protein
MWGEWRGASRERQGFVTGDARRATEVCRAVTEVRHTAGVRPPRTVRNLRGSRLRHGRRSEPRRIPDGQGSAVSRGSPWPRFRTPQGDLRCSVLAYGPSLEHRKICGDLRSSSSAHGRSSTNAGLPWFEMVAIGPFRPRRSLRGSKSPSGVDFEPRKSLRGWKPPYGEGFQPRRSLTGRIPRNPSPLPHQAITEVRLPHEPVPDVSRTPHVLGVSWRSQPERPAMRRPGRTSDGRSGRPRPGKLSPDRHRHDGRRSVMGRALGGSRC